MNNSKQFSRIGVIGLGYVGLPLALLFVNKGLKVIGLEHDEKKLRLLLKGKSYITDVTDKDLHTKNFRTLFLGTTDQRKLKFCDAVIICVPTPLDHHHQPDISYIESAVDMLKGNLKKGALVVLESTTYPGTTEEIIGARLIEAGYKLDWDFFLAFSPERVDPGNPKFKIQNTPKVVGGVSSASTELAKTLYSLIVEQVHVVSTARVAEMEKLFENIFRSVNIALVNELALLCDRMKIDVWEVIQAASTKPYGFMKFTPGPGIGGHCIPLDPFYLSWKAKEYGFNSRFIELAGEINERMPHYIVTKVIYALNQQRKCLNGARVLVLGLAYKKDIGDYRESPAIPVIKGLLKKGAKLVYHDPYVKEINDHGLKLKSTRLNYAELKKYDCVVIVTDHSKIDYMAVARNAKCVVDTRNVITSRKLKNVYRI